MLLWKHCVRYYVRHVALLPRLLDRGRDFCLLFSPYLGGVFRVIVPSETEDLRNGQVVDSVPFLGKRARME